MAADTYTPVQMLERLVAFDTTSRGSNLELIRFVEEYLAGRTPIPCTLCNNHVKFDQFLDMVCYGKGKPKDGDVITIGN